MPLAFGAVQNPHVIPDAEIVLDDLVTVSGEDQQTVTYIYLGVPRRGVEVLKLSFDSGASIPSLDYQGTIQTPGNASRLHIQRFAGSGSYPEALLYVADYDGGIRIYQHPVGQGGN
jgi:hypothetical protein